MPDPETVEAFVATVEAGDYVGAIERFYAPEASMRENTTSPARGPRDALVEHERGVMGAFAKITAARRAPPMISGDRVAVWWRFDFDLHQGGKRVLEEIAWQTWRDGRIVEEVFFYDPAQMSAPPPTD